ncbi:hypothetical protein D3C85_1083060 [compost metagenome]
MSRRLGISNWVETSPRAQRPISSDSNTPVRVGSFMVLSFCWMTGCPPELFGASGWRTRRISTRVHSAGRNNSVSTVPTSTPPIST